MSGRHDRALPNRRSNPAPAEPSLRHRLAISSAHLQLRTVAPQGRSGAPGDDRFAAQGPLHLTAFVNHGPAGFAGNELVAFRAAPVVRQPQDYEPLPSVE